MKRIFVLCLALLLIFTLPACGRKSQKPSDPAPSTAPETVTPSVPPEIQAPEEPQVPSETSSENPEPSEAVPEQIPSEDPEAPSENVPSEPTVEEPESSIPVPDEDGWYYDLENVTAYLMAYGRLPSNYITKRDAEDLGWSGGSIQRFKEGAAIGGGRFGNYEGLLPEGKYTECDIDTDGASSRGAKRLVFSTDGRYYYTDDHYETFAEVTFVDGRMVLSYDY